MTEFKVEMFLGLPKQNFISLKGINHIGVHSVDLMEIGIYKNTDRTTNEGGKVES
jgi:hypothetical protein